MSITRFADLALTIAGAFPAAANGAGDYPDIPEPMVFDMVRPMGARRGEWETNVLALSPLSGQERALEWAPEVEYAVAHGFALEFELPFEGARLAEWKIGAQATIGTFDRGGSSMGCNIWACTNARADGRRRRSSRCWGVGTANG